MASVRTIVEPIDREVDVVISEMLSPEAQRRMFADIARVERDEAVRTNTVALGRAPTYTTFVNGKAGASEDSVTVPGTVVYEFDIAEKLLQDIDSLLFNHSPYLTGRYSKSHRMFVGGVEYDPETPLPELVTEEIIFLNIQPYARKIERGLSSQAPEGVYQTVAAIIARKYSAIATIRFTYRAFVEGGIMAYGGSANAKRVERQNRQPAITVRLK